MRHPRLWRDLTQLRADLGADLGLHQLRGDHRDRLTHEITVLACEHASNDISGSHPSTFGHRGAPSHRSAGTDRRAWTPRWSEPLRGARYTTSTDMTRLGRLLSRE
jgi:hypothetical protein